MEALHHRERKKAEGQGPEKTPRKEKRVTSREGKGRNRHSARGGKGGSPQKKFSAGFKGTRSLPKKGPRSLPHRRKRKSDGDIETTGDSRHRPGGRSQRGKREKASLTAMLLKEPRQTSRSGNPKERKEKNASLDLFRKKGLSEGKGGF